MALITGLMLLFMCSSLLVGFLTVVMADSRVRRVDKTRTQSFYAAYAGLEKLTSDLGNLFVTDFSPAASQIVAIETAKPTMTDIQFTATDGLGYNVLYPGEPGVPVATPRDVTSGPFAGLKGLVTRYDLTTTARTVDGSESRVARSINTVSLPVFQFGIFSDLDLTFSANDIFQFGGRVHTNGNLWLTAATGRHDHPGRPGHRVRRGHPHAPGQRPLERRHARGHGQDGQGARQLSQPAGDRGQQAEQHRLGEQRADVDEPVDRHLQQLHPQQPDGREDARTCRSCRWARRRST